MTSVNSQTPAKDIHSDANPQQIRVTHVDLDWMVLFEQKSIKGPATLSIVRTAKLSRLILDSRDLNIEKVELSDNGKAFNSTTFGLGTADKFLGSPLTIQLSPSAKFVRVFIQRIRPPASK